MALFSSWEKPSTIGACSPVMPSTIPSSTNLSSISRSRSTEARTFLPDLSDSAVTNQYPPQLDVLAMISSLVPVTQGSPTSRPLATTAEA